MLHVCVAGSGVNGVRANRAVARVGDSLHTFLKDERVQSARPDRALPRIQRAHRCCRWLPNWTAPDGRSLALSGTTAASAPRSMQSNVSLTVGLCGRSWPS